MEHLQYPIGRFESPSDRSPAQRLEYVTAIGEFPKKFRAVSMRLHQAGRLDTPYRPGGWTGRQVIHHVLDSHVNAYVRHKRILTEDHPSLTPYDEQRWAKLPDVDIAPIRVSLDGLEALHLRWSVLLTQCTESEWNRTAVHAESGITYHLDILAAQYAWHGAHHLGHLRLLLP